MLAFAVKQGTENGLDDGLECAEKKIQQPRAGMMLNDKSHGGEQVPAETRLSECALGRRGGMSNGSFAAARNGK